MAGVGIYGVTASDVAHRRTEIGIRMALGAQQADIVRLAMTRSVVGSAIGISLGLAFGATLTRYVEGMLFGVTALDSVTFWARRSESRPKAARKVDHLRV
jgi:ABC-type antimicrobial peptide transport system permease subunit